ncbi:CheR family methyltransferase [Methanococcoides burtonii]|uniref:protein-glutamate O-methyltransferase n=1 Tax=Methanococcoides burtonii (strain DSM 6242 / NBRC 107633 / OCM 468 / ACE-M) TaxID=259564 RepID=Q12YW7_METBU|nr:protein-glutamate O-methyltransferase CheR [Methanococcoides burtonii]ABE51359.1 CheR methyltransferase-like chemotaxis protein [Methanococcoides burtonii DSM 6242]
MDVSTMDPFNLLTKKISKSSGIILDGYRDSYLKRRIDLRMRAIEVSDYKDYSQLLDKNEDELAALIDTLTVNVTEFMRDKTPFVYFKDKLIADIIERKQSSQSKLVRFWSAGCSNGEEPYSIGICAKEALPKDWNISIYATDIDVKCLKNASEGVYCQDKIEKLDPILKDKYFERSEDNFKIKNIQNLSYRFKNYDLTNDSPVSKHFDTVFCRNVMIYFNEGQKVKMISNFHESLTKGGYLIIGKSETLPPEVRSLFETVSVRDKIYMKI